MTLKCGEGQTNKDAENMRSFTLIVRDYEMDSHGVVNHSVYLNYLEEARKNYLAQLGFNFTELLKKNIGFVVTSSEIDYLHPLVGGDEVVVETTMKRLSRLKFHFTQNIFLLPEKKPVARGRIVVVPINRVSARPQWFDELDSMLTEFPAPKNASN